jgi:DNA-binding NtrC family response regulator
MKSKSILIAYQDDIWARPLYAFFQELGYRVEMVTVVNQMVQRVLNRDIHVLLLDDEVEGRKACELVPLLKSVNRRVQAIVVSSQESLEVVRQLRSAGIFYQAMKPVDLEELKSAVGCAFAKIQREGFIEGLFSFFVPSRIMALCSS